MMAVSLPEINPADPLAFPHDLTTGLAYWFVAYPAIMAGTKWWNLGGVIGINGTGTLTNFTFPPSATSGWSVRHGMHPGGRGALCFNNGTNRLLFNGTGNLLTSGTPFTLAWWERITDTAQSTPARFTLLYDVGNTPSSFLVIRTNTTALAMFWGPNGANPGVGAAIGTVAGTAGQWQHIVLVSTAGPQSVTAADWAVYRNGTLITPTSQAGTVSGTTGDTRIGRTGANDQVNSALDDVAIWPGRALSPSEARAWYHSSLQGHPRFLQTLAFPLFAPSAAGGFVAAWARGHNIGQGYASVA